MLRRRTLAAFATASVLCDTLASEVGVTWLTVPQRDGRRSRSSTASVSISGDGRYVAFSSYARLSAADVDSLADIYVLDRSTATVTLESVAVDGRPLNSDCNYPSISADGRYMTFTTVVADDADRSVTDVVFRDRVADRSRRITMAPGGALSNGWSSQPVLSANASAVVFTSAATNLLSEPDVNGLHPDIYRFDVGTGAIERISVDSRGAQQQGGSLMPSVSGDGRYVAFSSTAVLSSPRNGSDRPRSQGQYPLIYLRDTRTRQTTLVSGASEPPNGATTMAAISADGRTVAFASRATNLVARDRNKASDVFLYDVDTRAVTLVSRGRRTAPPMARASIPRSPPMAGSSRFSPTPPTWPADEIAGPAWRTSICSLTSSSSTASRVRSPASAWTPTAPGWRRAEPRRSTRPARWWRSPLAIPFPSLDVLNDFDLFVRITPAAGESRAP